MPSSVREQALSCVVGALEQEDVDDGVLFHRVPSRARRRLADPLLGFMSAVTSGVRLHARTGSGRLELDVTTTQLAFGDAEPRPSCFDIVIDGRERHRASAGHEGVVRVGADWSWQTEAPAMTSTLTFDLGSAGTDKDVEVWFPAGTVTTLVDVRVDEGHDLVAQPVDRPRWVHHGSSISQCSEVDGPTQTWPALVARETGHHLLNLGIGGECHLDQFMAQAIRDQPADLISLELGINVVNADSMRERAFVAALHGFLDTVRLGHPHTPVVVVTPIVCPAAESRPGPTVLTPQGTVDVLERPRDLEAGALSLTRIRTLLREHVNLRRCEGDANLHVVDGLRLFGAEDLDHLPDHLHPDTTGYALMARRFLESVFGDDGVLR